MLCRLFFSRKGPGKRFYDLPLVCLGLNIRLAAINFTLLSVCMVIIRKSLFRKSY